MKLVRGWTDLDRLIRVHQRDIENSCVVASAGRKTGKTEDGPRICRHGHCLCGIPHRHIPDAAAAMQREEWSSAFASTTPEHLQDRALSVAAGCRTLPVPPKHHPLFDRDASIEPVLACRDEDHASSSACRIIDGLLKRRCRIG